MPDCFEFAGPAQLLRLLDAVMAIGSEQSLPDALRRITETAADLVDATYAALGVLDESGSRLAEIITVGFSEEVTARVGAPPEGHGIIGLLILEPHPLRLPDLQAHVPPIKRARHRPEGTAASRPRRATPVRAPPCDRRDRSARRRGASHLRRRRVGRAGPPGRSGGPTR